MVMPPVVVMGAKMARVRDMGAMNTGK